MMQVRFKYDPVGEGPNKRVEDFRVEECVQNIHDLDCMDSRFYIYHRNLQSDGWNCVRKEFYTGYISGAELNL